jgi:DNA-binding GntR family transcriptional regulator
VVLKRLEAEGLAERLGARSWELSPALTKKAMKAARSSPKRGSS